VSSVSVTPAVAAAIGTERRATSKSLTLSRGTVKPGETLEATGAGCAAKIPVVISIDGNNVGTTTTNDQGAFATSITPLDLGAGQVTVTATCGSTQLTALLATVATATVSSPEVSAGIFGVFVLLGLVLFRGQFTSNVTRRRRRRGAADILDMEQD
jgi:uncharacterized membrane protein YgdD (TMEM256/DUF423 family)